MASMGPRTYIRGNNALWRVPERRFSLCFNGAADLHPRKFSSAFSAPMKTLCFNGAADLHPRKSANGPNNGRIPDLASMGPRTYIRGN